MLYDVGRGIDTSIPNTDRVSRAAIEFQKLVEFGTVPFEEPLLQ